MNLKWKPHAKQRPRTTMVNGRAVTYTPKTTKDAEKNLREQWAVRGPDPAKGPISVRIILHDDTVQVSIKETAPHESVKLRGDVDNYAKLILDALNGVAWLDDSQIVHLEVEKA